MKKIAVLLTVFNRKAVTLECLKALYAQPIPEGYAIEVYLTDDGCTDGTPDAVSARFPQVHIVKGDGNLYWNRGMIAAWKAAAEAHDYDYYLWLNDDTMLKERAIERLLHYAAQSGDRSCVIGSCHATDDEQRLTYGGLKSDVKYIFPSEKEMQPCDAFCGNIVLIPRKVYEVLGTMDPYYHHEAGDYDYGFRAREAGLVNLVAPGFYGVCDRHRDLGKWADPSLSLKERWAAYMSPTGHNPRESFHFNLKHHGLYTALYRFASITTIVLSPTLRRARLRPIKTTKAEE